MAGDPAPFLAAARKYGSQPDFNQWAQKTYGVTGPVLLAKVAKGESGFDMGAVSSAGARGGTQFMPGTRQDFMRRYGVDPWAGPDQAIHATQLYLQHDPRGLAGYNPGDPGYTHYILSQKIGGLPAATAPTAPSSGPAPMTSTRTVTTPGVDNSALRRQYLSDFLQQGGVRNSNATLAFASGIQGAQDTPGGSRTVQTAHGDGVPAAPTGAPASGPYVNRITQRANTVDSRHLPYQWGGGHGGKVAPLKQAVPVDCSGAVSEVLGINPRVAVQFETFGKPGDGGNRGVTIYASKTHVLMKINGRFFGTSGSNPGGGAGWIPAGAIPSSYLKGFVARHL